MRTLATRNFTYSQSSSRTVSEFSHHGSARIFSETTG